MKNAFRFAAILALSALMTMSESEAGRRHGSSGGSYGSIGSRSSGGSYGSYGSSGGRVARSYSSSGGSASSGGSSGRVRKVRVRKVRVRRYRGSSGSYGSTGSSGGSYSSRGSSSYGGGYHAPVYSQPTYHAAPTGCATGNCPVSSTTTPVAAPRYAGYALLVVNVPQNATVYLGNKQMQTQGETRKFRIPVRTAGQNYSYSVRVEQNQNGRTQVATYTRAIAAGKMTVVNAKPASTNGSIEVASL